MRIDGPKGLGAWLFGWFSGSFKGNLEGTSSFAETASYIHQDGVDGLENTLDEYLHREKGGVVGGEVVLSGSVNYSSRLTVHGNITVIGSITEGLGTDAAGDGSHAEGTGSKALGAGSHAEGKQTVAVGAGSHAEGIKTKALGAGSHAEGAGTQALGIGSHAEGRGTIAAGDYQLVAGMYNVPDASNKYLFVVGNGDSEEQRSNALAVRKDGGVELGGSDGEGMVLSGSVIQMNNAEVIDLTIKSQIDQIGKVKLEYQDAEDALAFRFLSKV